MSNARLQEWLLSHKSESQENIQEKKPHPSVGLRKKAITINVTGGKGGVGKTSISLKMAMELGQLGFKVLYIDCDYNLSNSFIKLNLPIDDRFLEYVQGKRRLEECLHKYAGVDILPACNGSIELLNGPFSNDQIILEILAKFENNYDVIILDSPAGLQKDSLSLTAYCDYRILVVVPDKSSVTDCYSLMKVLKLGYGINRNHLLVNRVRAESQYLKLVNCLVETCDNYLGQRLSILGQIPEMDCSNDKFDRQFLHEEKNTTSKMFNNFLQRLVDEIGIGLPAGIVSSEIPKVTKIVRQDVQQPIL